jgi:nucleoside-diphosphate-sugar epimerase
MSRLLVTGATGFIGCEVIRQLDRGTFEIHAVSRNAPADREDDVTWHQADLLNESEVGGLLARIAPSHLLHLAWDLGGPDYRTTVRNLDWLIAGARLARAFRENGGRRAVFAGTCAEHERELSLYAACKTALAESVRAYARADNWHFAWGRIYWPYGPRGAPHRWCRMSSSGSCREKSRAVRRACRRGISCTSTTSRRG